MHYAKLADDKLGRSETPNEHVFNTLVWTPLDVAVEQFANIVERAKLDKTMDAYMAKGGYASALMEIWTRRLEGVKRIGEHPEAS